MVGGDEGAKLVQVTDDSEFSYTTHAIASN